MESAVKGLESLCKHVMVMDGRFCLVLAFHNWFVVQWIWSGTKVHLYLFHHRFLEVRLCSRSSQCSGLGEVARTVMVEKAKEVRVSEGWSSLLYDQTSFCYTAAIFNPPSVNTRTKPMIEVWVRGWNCNSCLSWPRVKTLHSSWQMSRGSKEWSGKLLLLITQVQKSTRNRAQRTPCT